jgi:hypothetical protein
MSSQEQRSFLVADANFLIVIMALCSVALLVFFCAVIMVLEGNIRTVAVEQARQKEKISSLEDVVFNNDVYPNMKQIKVKEK